MEQQKWYQIDFYIGMYDLEELSEKYSFKESVDKIINLIGDCTIVPCIGSYQHPIGIRVSMNSLKVIKFTNSDPKEFVLMYTDKFKEIFNQKSIITNIINCYELNFNTK